MHMYGCVKFKRFKSNKIKTAIENTKGMFLHVTIYTLSTVLCLLTPFTGSLTHFAHSLVTIFAVSMTLGFRFLTLQILAHLTLNESRHSQRTQLFSFCHFSPTLKTWSGCDESWQPQILSVQLIVASPLTCFVH